MIRKLSFYFFIIFSILPIKYLYTDTYSSEEMWNLQQSYIKMGLESENTSTINFKIYQNNKKNNSNFKEIKNEKLDVLFDNANNLSTIIIKDNEIIYSRINKNKKINFDSTLNGMSVSKSALSSVIGKLYCDGKISSLNDKMGVYSKFLEKTPYKNVTIKEALQMKSGVSEIGRKDEGLLVAKALGLGKFQGKGSLENVLLSYDSASTRPGSRFNYHQTDTIALSVLVSNLTGKSVSEIFYEDLYLTFAKSNNLIWVADSNDYTVGFSSLSMSSVDWVFFGNFILEEIKKNTCLGNYFKEGMSNSIKLDNKDNYGYHFWYDAKNNIINFSGTGGQSILIYEKNNIALFVSSLSSNYSGKNVWEESKKLIKTIQ